VALLGFGVSRRPWAALVALAAGLLPSAAVNIAWNQSHSWVNILFNVYNRNTDAHFAPLNAVALILLAALLAGPGVLLQLLRRNARGRLPWSEAWSRMRESRLDLFLVAFAIPLTVFLAVSIFQSVGLHWLISFQPFLFAALVAKFDSRGLRRMLKPTAIYAIVLASLIAIIAPLPLESVRWHKSYDSIVLGSRPGEVLEALAPYTSEFELTSPSYAQAALLGFHTGRSVPVIGLGSHHARQDDLNTDFRKLDGRNLMILSNNPERVAMAGGWFDAVEIRTVVVRDAAYTVVLGRGFRFDVYREQVLRRISEAYYTKPAWLEKIAAPCFFRTRYGFDKPGG